MTVHEQIKQEVDLFPNDLAQMALELILFIKAQYPAIDDERLEEDFLWQKVLETKQYRQQHPEEVVTVTAEEWEKLSAELDEDQA